MFWWSQDFILFRSIFHTNQFGRSGGLTKDVRTSVNNFGRIKKFKRLFEFREHDFYKYINITYMYIVF